MLAPFRRNMASIYTDDTFWLVELSLSTAMCPQKSVQNLPLLTYYTFLPVDADAHTVPAYTTIYCGSSYIWTRTCDSPTIQHSKSHLNRKFRSYTFDTSYMPDRT